MHVHKREYTGLYTAGSIQAWLGPEASVYISYNLSFLFPLVYCPVSPPPCPTLILEKYIIIIFFSDRRLCVCVCVCVLCMGLQVWRSWENWVSCSVILHSAFEQSFPQNLGLGWWPANPDDSLVSAPPSPRLFCYRPVQTATPSFYVGAGI